MPSVVERSARLYSYYKTVEWPLLLEIVLELLWYVSGAHVIIGWVGRSYYIAIPWLFRLLCFLYIGRIIAVRWKKGWLEGAVAGALSGSIMGIVIGLFYLFWYGGALGFLTFIALPWKTIIIGMFVSGLAAHIIKLWREEREKVLNEFSKQ